MDLIETFEKENQTNEERENAMVVETNTNTQNTKNTILENTVQNKNATEKNAEINRYLDALKTWGSSYDVFRIRDGEDKYLLCEITPDGRAINLTNALPVITKKITYTNGIEEEKKYELIVYVLDNNDKKLGPVEITEKELSKLINTITSNFIGEVINYRANSDKKMREVIEIIGRESVVTEKIYSHTGFIRENGKLKFLYHGGCIVADDDNDTGIKTDLEKENLSQYCFTNKSFDKNEALNTEYSLLELADLKIMAPLIAITFLSPIFSLLQEEGFFVDFVLLLIGKTGTFKSSLSALLLSHYGNFELNTLPLSFRATFASIERIASIANQVLLVIDDYKPEKLETDQEKILEGVLGLWGDRSKRIKMNSHGGLHKQYTPKGLAMVTGERAPKFSQGRIARALTVYIQEGSINFEKLKSIHSKKEQLAFVMKEYIKYIIKNEKDIKAKAKHLQELYSKKLPNFQHPRIKQNLIAIFMGFTIWLDFMLENSIIDSAKRNELIEMTCKELEQVGRNQESDVDDEDPIKIFFKTLGQLQIAKKVYITDYKTGISSQTTTGIHVGYFDNETNQYYLIADTVYKEVEKACIGRFIATPKQLYKSLADDGYIITDKDNRKVSRKTDPITKNKVEVLTIPKAKWNEVMKGTENTTS